MNTLRQLVDACAALAIEVSPLGLVREKDAARLLGYGHPRSLRNARSWGMAPEHVRIGGRVYYELSELSAYIDGGRGD